MVEPLQNNSTYCFASRQVEDFENRLYNLASYLESLASIIRHMDEVTDAHAISLEHLLVLLLENIPNIHTTKHYVCMRAILWVLLAVMPKGTAFKQILSGFGKFILSSYFSLMLFHLNSKCMLLLECVL